MAVTTELIGDIAEEFAAVDQAKLDRLSALLGPQVPASVWGDRADLALAYLICHTMKLSQIRGKGAVTSEKIGDLAVTYDAPKSTKSDNLDSTSYGAEFKRIRATIVAGPRVTC